MSNITKLPSSRGALSRYSSGDANRKFLPRLQMSHPLSKVVTDGQIVAGHFFIPGSGDTPPEDLGDSLDLLPLAVRDKALDTNGDKPTVSYDWNSDLFQDIKSRHEADRQNSGCLYGPSVLVVERSSGRLLEWFLGNPTGRYVADSLNRYMPIGEEEAKEHEVPERDAAPFTVTSFLRRDTNKKTGRENAYYVPLINQCSTPIDRPEGSEEAVRNFLEETGDEPQTTLPSGRER